jgi:hypothetical protein
VEQYLLPGLSPKHALVFDGLLTPAVVVVAAKELELLMRLFEELIFVRSMYAALL